MKEKDITLRLAEYMEENEISTRQVALDTEISEEKLQADTQDCLSAAEFLSLCSYLNIRPEEL